MVYWILNMDDGERNEYPLKAKTDEGARRAAAEYAKENKIKKYGIVFYRSSDGCRGWIDN